MQNKACNFSGYTSNDYCHLTINKGRDVTHMNERDRKSRLKNGEQRRENQTKREGSRQREQQKGRLKNGEKEWATEEKSKTRGQQKMRTTKSENRRKTTGTREDGRTREQQ
jgi:hypothetical protein